MLPPRCGGRYPWEDDDTRGAVGTVVVVVLERSQWWYWNGRSGGSPCTGLRNTSYLYFGPVLVQGKLGVERRSKTTLTNVRVSTIVGEAQVVVESGVKTETDLSYTEHPMGS